MKKFTYSLYISIPCMISIIGMWLYLSGVATIIGVIMAILVLISIVFIPKFVSVNRPNKDKPTLLLDSIIVILSWISFFFKENISMWESVFCVGVFVLALTDIYLWIINKKHYVELQKYEARWCIVETIISLSLACLVTVSYWYEKNTTAYWLLITMVSAVALFILFIGVSCFKNKPCFYNEFKIGYSLDIVLFVFLVYEFLTKDLTQELVQTFLLILLLFVDFIRLIYSKNASKYM